MIETVLLQLIGNVHLPVLAAHFSDFTGSSCIVILGGGDEMVSMVSPEGRTEGSQQTLSVSLKTEFNKSKKGWRRGFFQSPQGPISNRIISTDSVRKGSISLSQSVKQTITKTKSVMLMLIKCH